MKAVHRCRRRTALLAACLVGAALTAPAPAQEMHEHMPGGTSVSHLQLDGGRKWPTDASLRAGMGEIRKAFDADHPAIHSGQETDAQYEVLAARIEAQVNDIVKNCKLAPAADANLHYVIADLVQGASLMRRSDPSRSRHDGAALVHGALLAYGKYFDDPGWKP